MNLLQVLIDIFICKGLWVTGRLKYPLSILPKSQYIQRINIDKLYRDISLIIVRRSDKPKEEVFNKFGIMREDVITRGDIPGMSMNLLGGKFKYEHIRFNPVGEAAKTWTNNEKIFYSQYRKCVNLLPLTTPIFFEISNLHNIDFPYPRSKDKDLEKLMNALQIEPIESDGKFELHGKSSISHEPTRLNYWHVEFQIRDFENKLIEKIKSTWQKDAASMALKHLISINASLECPHISEIPKSYFYKRTENAD